MKMVVCVIACMHVLNNLTKSKHDWITTQRVSDTKTGINREVSIEAINTRTEKLASKTSEKTITDVAVFLKSRNTSTVSLDYTLTSKTALYAWSNPCIFYSHSKFKLQWMKNYQNTQLSFWTVSCHSCDLDIQSSSVSATKLKLLVLQLPKFSNWPHAKYPKTSPWRSFCHNWTSLCWSLRSHFFHGIQ